MEKIFGRCASYNIIFNLEKKNPEKSMIYLNLKGGGLESPPVLIGCKNRPVQIGLKTCL